MVQRFDFTDLSLPGVKLITCFTAEDGRGKTIKDYSYEVFFENGVLFQPMETLYINSKKNVLRGLHFQRVKGQSKLIRCIYGSVWAVIVDINKNSPTLGKWLSLELTSDKCDEIYIPGEFAVGTLALEDAEIVCKCGEKFYAEYSDGIFWNDPKLRITWPINDIPILSEKDAALQSFQTYLDK